MPDIDVKELSDGFFEEFDGITDSKKHGNKKKVTVMYILRVRKPNHYTLRLIFQTDLKEL
jgi:hypothetical protein